MDIRWVCLFASVSAFAAPVAAYAQQVEEVVVTAQKRVERLQDVPVAVTPFTSAQLEKSGTVSTLGLTNVTPAPQGTPFGRNAMGGAINVITTPPSQKASAKMGVSYARLGEKVGGGAYASYVKPWVSRIKYE